MPSTSSKQGRWWSVTCFNMDWHPTEEVLKNGMSFCAGQKEECGSTGRLHWQMVAHWDKKVRFTTVKSSFPEGAHIELSRSQAADEYVKKIETAKSGTYFCFGERVLNRNSKQFWDKQWQLAKSGNWQDCEGDVKIKYYNTLKRIAFDHAAPPVSLLAPCGVWIFGPPGVGKSFSAREWYPDLFVKNLNKWWDGYKGEKQVLLDDVGHDHGKWIGWFLKIWADQYVFDGEVKGGTIKLRPDKLIVTSNYTIEDLFAFDQQLSDAISRRFYKIFIPEKRY